MNKGLTRYWFKAKRGMGIGVSGYSLEDAISILNSEPTIKYYEPCFDSYIENVNIQELDGMHVLPNMGVCSVRGIWFPLI